MAPFGGPEHLDLPPCGIGQAAWLARQHWLPRARHGQASLASSGYWARSCSWLAVPWQPDNGSAYLAWPDWPDLALLDDFAGPGCSQELFQTLARQFRTIIFAGLPSNLAKLGARPKIKRNWVHDPKAKHAEPIFFKFRSAR